ncbi:MAG: haloacid dehalogenase-like hydrolase [Candidatus Hydrogenedentes bacterium]|nr:haloacid dehalogenase-like hydrolase [Candidatus Hydrogenedentota bacterium]
MFFQNVIALIWDFDHTLSPHYMQRPLFREYGIDEAAFWREVNALPAYYERGGVHVQADTCYLGHLLSYVRNGRMPGLSNAKLRELGGAIEFFPGIPEFFDRLAGIVNAPEFKEGDLEIELEHYVVSTGLAEMIRGSAIASRLDGIWASEFIEEPAAPGADLSGAPPSGPIGQIAGFLDNTTKTRALFEINKGVNKSRSITVNDTIPEEERRVPFKNMIYIADGPSDIPSFSVVKKHGGGSYAVYAPGDEAQFAQVNALQAGGRVDSIGPADYSANSQTDMWIRHRVTAIARRILNERKRAFRDKVGPSPGHLPDRPDEA